MKNEKGVSLITLVVTILVMLILLVVVAKYSFDNIVEANKAVAVREVANVREFVLDKQIRINDDDVIELLSNFSSLVLTDADAHKFLDDKISEEDIANIIEVNASSLEARYKYFYLPKSGKYFEDYEFSADGIKVKDVKNDYIVNFYTGIVINLSKDNFMMDGMIKDLTRIQSDIANEGII